VGAVFTALVVCLSTTGPIPAFGAHTKPHKLTSKQKRARERRVLLGQIRRNPRLALRRDFMTRASDVGLDLPLTVRLNRATDSTPAFATSDDLLEIAWTDDTVPWPSSFTLLPGSVADVALSHGFTMEAHFGADTSGYGQPGVIETTQGQGVELLTATTGPIDVADLNPACGFSALRIDAMSLGRGDTTQGILDLFNSQVRGRLHLLATISSSVRPSCGSDWADAGTYVPSATGDPVLPVTFDGTFRVSPAITADGYVRLGTISVSDAAEAQTSSLGKLTMCTQPVGTGCGTQSFPARLKLKTLTAELLLGRIPLWVRWASLGDMSDRRDEKARQPADAPAGQLRPPVGDRRGVFRLMRVALRAVALLGAGALMQCDHRQR
jgi:hypothetical protein